MFFCMQENVWGMIMRGRELRGVREMSLQTTLVGASLVCFDVILDVVCRPKMMGFSAVAL